MKPTLKVGQTLYALNVGNEARGREQVLTPGTVTKVGRKYFDFQFKDHWRAITYHIDTWAEKSEYSATYQLYESPKAWEDSKRSKELCESIHKSFEYGYNRFDISLENLEKINRIITVNK